MMKSSVGSEAHLDEDDSREMVDEGHSLLPHAPPSPMKTPVSSEDQCARTVKSDPSQPNEDEAMDQMRPESALDETSRDKTLVAMLPPPPPTVHVTDPSHDESPLISFTEDDGYGEVELKASTKPYLTTTTAVVLQSPIEVVKQLPPAEDSTPVPLLLPQVLDDQSARFDVDALSGEAAMAQSPSFFAPTDGALCPQPLALEIPTEPTARQQLSPFRLDLHDDATAPYQAQSFASSGRRSAASVKPPTAAALDISTTSCSPRASTASNSPTKQQQRLSPMIHVDVPTSPRRRASKTSTKSASSSPPRSPPDDDDDAENWIVCQADTGDTYYYNTRRHISQWAAPPSLRHVYDHQSPDQPDSLHVAVSDGDLSRVEALLAAGVAPDGLDDEGRSALWYALEHVDIAQVLLEHGADAATRLDVHGTTLLHLVTRQRNIEMLALLLATSALDVDARDGHQQTALHVAATFGFRRCVEMLLDYGASPAVLDGNSQTPIMLSTLGSHVGCVQLLQMALAQLMAAAAVEEDAPLQEGTRIEQLETQVAATTKAFEDTQRAYQQLQEEMTLLRHDKSQHTETLETAYRIANSRIAMLEALAKRTNDEHEHERTIWHAKEAKYERELVTYMDVMKSLQEDVASFIERHPHSPKASPPRQQQSRPPSPTPPFVAAYSPVYTESAVDESNGGQDDAMAVDRARVDAVWSQFFMNAAQSKLKAPADLMQAVLDANYSDVATLLASGHSPNQRDDFNRSPLHLASDIGDADMLALLCESMGDIEARDAKGNTPLHIACFRGHVGCVKFLVESAADVVVVNTDGDSVVHASASSGSLPCLRLVVEYGATPSGRNKMGETAYDMLLERDGPVTHLLDFLQSAMNATASPAKKQPMRHAPVPPTQYMAVDDMDEFVSPASSPVAAPPYHVNIYDRENDADDEDDVVTQKLAMGLAPDGWGGWIRVTASSMFGLAKKEDAYRVVDEDPASPMKPPTDAEVLTTAKYHELVPPAHVSEAMKHVQPRRTAMELPQDVAYAMKQRAAKATPNRYAMAGQVHAKSMQRSSSRYVDPFHPANGAE
ncbi:Aste57867_10618 [Aphanomyces stellatus]|uniref:Aste57867_10618 protein n=1 Tax=Aphanomyces stellatus TaxID=120398 RepID=A0A485KQX7_9STRA|nr:hypothetical protein As57867_010578 [Aphanomyces stellatus]VFT87490.1 Aste57867_10618 [Aphanomyces stellatus]